MKINLLTKYQKGTSLIELILYFSLLGIVLIIATDIMLRTSEFSLESAAGNDLQDDAKFIISRFSYDIRRADSISLPAALGDSSGALTLAVGSETHTYTLNGSDLEYQETIGPNSQTGNLNSNRTKLNYLTFERLGNTGGNPAIKITFELEGTTAKKGGAEQKTFATVVSQR